MADIGVPLGIGSVFPLPRINVGRWIVGVVGAALVKFQTGPRPGELENRYHHPRREGFLESAAMSREMFRL